MLRRAIGLGAVLTMLGSAGVLAQETGTPYFHAPYRAFERHEFGATLSFPSGGTAIEGFYRFGAGQLDLGLRGGVLDPDEPGGRTTVILGVSGRDQVITHSEDFPLDGAIVLGVGALLVEDNSRLLVPLGLSLGRRLNIEDSPVSIVPFAEPLLFADIGSDFDLRVALGLGGDFRLSRSFDVRVAVGVGDLEGIAVSAAWIR